MYVCVSVCLSFYNSRYYWPISMRFFFFFFHLIANSNESDMGEKNKKRRKNMSFFCKKKNILLGVSLTSAWKIYSKIYRILITDCCLLALKYEYTKTNIMLGFVRLFFILMKQNQHSVYRFSISKTATK